MSEIPENRSFVTNAFLVSVLFIIFFPLFVGLIFFFVQSVIYVFTWEWPYITILTILKTKLINSNWAENPTDFFGLHKILGGIDLWMFIPLGIIWIALVTIFFMPWVTRTAWIIEMKVRRKRE